MVLGVTNDFSALDALDYRLITDKGLAAQYQSISNGMSMEHDGTRWSITYEANQMLAAVESTQPFPNGIDRNAQWTLENGQLSPYLSVHCEVPGREELYTRLRRQFEHCDVTTMSNREGVEFDNEHFRTVVQRDADEWTFGLDDDYKHFSWNWTGSEGGQHSVSIPSIGIGTAGISNDRDVIEWAVQSGYELIDSASDHGMSL